MPLSEEWATSSVGCLELWILEIVNIAIWLVLLYSKPKADDLTTILVFPYRTVFSIANKCFNFLAGERKER